MIAYTDKSHIPFKIDDCDFEAVSRYTWALDGRYISTNIGRRPHMRKLRLHVFLLGAAREGLEWDHVNRDPLDNRRSNLRAIEHWRNGHNRSRQSNNTSGVKGVWFTAREKRWVAEIKIAGRKYSLGYYLSFEAACHAREEGARSLLGEA